MAEDISKLRIPAPEPPDQVEPDGKTGKDPNVDKVIRVVDARKDFGVDGTGLTVAVLDTGLRATHEDFAGRVLAQKNFTADNGGNPDDASDGQGHGTNVGGIIVANKLHVGVAPGGNIIPLKVLGNTGGGGFDAVEQALAWVKDNREAFNITVVSMSLGASNNPSDDTPFRDTRMAALLRELRDACVPVVIAAGNSYFQFQEEGMGFPAIYREAISVGAVYDTAGNGYHYGSGAASTKSAVDQITPFSQRLSDDPSRPTRTTVFAPGAPVVSSGMSSDKGESVQQGTSQATPVVSGVILLMQQLYQNMTGKLPTVDLLIEAIRSTGAELVDADNGVDNVPHTNKTFLRIDAYAALAAIQHAAKKELVEKQSASR